MNITLSGNNSKRSYIYMCKCKNEFKYQVLVCERWEIKDASIVYNS